MASVNKVIVIGNLGQEPEVRYMSNGDAVCNLSVATSSAWKDKNTGGRKEETEWHRVVLYRRLAEIAGEYCKKGRPVYIEGRLKTKKWQDQNGVERYTTEIIAESLQLLGGKDDSGGSQASRQNNSNNDYASARGGSNNRPQRQAPKSVADLDDDIPF